MTESHQSERLSTLTFRPMISLIYIITYILSSHRLDHTHIRI